MSIKKFFIFPVLLIAGALIVVGCSRGPEAHGEPIDLEQATPISAILADAKGYAGKTVLIDGKISLECPTGCWFDAKDDTGTIYVDIASGGGFSIPQRTGRKIQVQGEVSVGESGLPTILGKGVVIR